MSEVYKVAVLPGDGIGPEVMDVSLEILKKIAEKFSFSFEFESADVGGIAIDNHGHPLPESTLELCKRSDAILFGSVGGPKWEKLPPDDQPERGALLPLRKIFTLYANLRPVTVYPGMEKESPLKNSEGVDVIIIRELIGGIYFGEPKLRKKDSAIDTSRYDRSDIERIAKVGFETAKLRGGRLMSVDKANVLATSVLWREVVTEIGERDYSDITLEHMYVDNAAMQLVIKPSQFDVILTENLFGDILSDLAAAIPGSLGMLPSASLGESSSDGRQFGLYEPAGGSAPDIAGKNLANPIAQILSGALMLKYSFDRDDAAQALESAVLSVINKGCRTGDIAGGGNSISTTEMADEIAAQI